MTAPARHRDQDAPAAASPDLRRLARVFAGLGVEAGDDDVERRRQILRRVLPIVGMAAPGGVPADADALARALRADLVVIGAGRPGTGADMLRDSDRYRWQASREAALARLRREAGTVRHWRARIAALRRAPSAAELTRLDGRTLIAEAFVRILGRPADAAAMRYYNDRLRHGERKAVILRDVAGSAEGRLKYAYVRGLWQTVRIFRRRLLVPAPVAWTARLVSRRRYRVR